MVSSGMGELAGVDAGLRARFTDPALTRDAVAALAREFVADVAAGRHRERGWPSSAYRVSKVALNALVRVWAPELAARQHHHQRRLPGLGAHGHGRPRRQPQRREGRGVDRLGGDARRASRRAASSATAAASTGKLTGVMNLDGARRAWWLPGAHLQTTWSRLTRSRRLVTFVRETLETPDGDELLIDHAGPADAHAGPADAHAGPADAHAGPADAHAGPADAHAAGPADAPRVLLLHGLEGSAHSFHTQGLAQLVTSAGWRAVVLNFRSCARDPADITRRLRNRRPRLYHSGETTDLALLVRTLAAREPGAPLYAIGFSLGGNVLLKWLGEVGGASAIRAAASISAPYDLAAASRYLERRVGRFYTAHFMRRLRAKALIWGTFSARDGAHRCGAHPRGAHVPRAGRLRDRAAVRVRGRGRLLRARELHGRAGAHRRADVVRVQRGRSAVSRRGGHARTRRGP